MPVLIPLAPPQILQAAPELMCLLDAPNFLPPCGLGFRRELMYQSPESFLQSLRELLVVLPKRVFRARGSFRVIRKGGDCVRTVPVGRTARRRVSIRWVYRRRISARPRDRARRNTPAGMVCRTFYRHNRWVRFWKHFLDWHSSLAFSHECCARNYLWGGTSL